MQIINVTAFPLKFLREDGSEFIVPPSGKQVNGRPIDKIVAYNNGISVITKEHSPNSNDEETLKEIYKAAMDCNIIIVGTPSAAKTYPGRVLSPIPAMGYEKVPVKDKKYKSTEFLAF